MYGNCTISCYGELLWDVFPTHKKIGGAPLNVALRLCALGHEVALISSVGDDPAGVALQTYLKKNGLNNQYIQIHSKYCTGEAIVTLDGKGTASYDLIHPCAWDNIRIGPALKKKVKASDIFIYGSLAARDEVSRQSLFALLTCANYKVFDVNLRPPHYTPSHLISLMNSADFIKCNDDELIEIANFLGKAQANIEQNIHYVAQKTATKHLCVTRGKAGAVLHYDDQIYYHHGYPIQVVDTVGAGDAFLAALISQLSDKKTPHEAIDFACAVGTLVAGHQGANPKLLRSEIYDFMRQNSSQEDV